MRHTNRRPGKEGQTAVEAWWDAVLLGETDEPHPILGSAVAARVKGEKLQISGRLDHGRDRDELLEQAAERIGQGIQEVDSSDLEVVGRSETPGILEQTVVAAFPNRETAQLARELVLERGRIKPLGEAIVDSGKENELRKLLPEPFVDDARQRINRGEALLVLRVDETAAFAVRRLLEEDTRSPWTIATPPALIAERG